MTSLYEQNPVHWDKLAAAGKPKLREMAKRFEHPADIDKALGINACAHHWHCGRNGASRPMEQLAAYWFEREQRTDDEQPQVHVPRKDDTDTRMLLIVATPDQAAKIEKIAAFIGAEVTDV